MDPAVEGLLARVGLVLLPAFGIWLIIKSGQLGRKWAALAKTPVQPIGHVKLGFAGVSGAIRTRGGVTRGPLSGENAAYGQYIIEEREGTRKTRQWTVVATGLVGRHFTLQDETGTISVDGDGADLDHPVTWSTESKMGTDPPPEALRLLRTHGLTYENFVGMNKTMQFHERLIPVGAEITVFGHVEADSKGGLVVRQEDGPFLITSRPSQALRRGQRNARLGKAIGWLLLLASAYAGAGLFGIL